MLENENARPAALSLLYTVPQMPPTEPDDRILFDALIEAGASEKAAFDAVQEVRKIAAQNIVAALEANKAALECHQAVISSLIEALNSKIDSRNSQIDKHLATKEDLQKLKVWWLLTVGAAVGSFVANLLSVLAK